VASMVPGAPAPWSRITSDSETINQALSFALINVLGGALLLVWLAYSMLVKSVPFGMRRYEGEP